MSLCYVPMVFVVVSQNYLWNFYLWFVVLNLSVVREGIPSLPYGHLGTWTTGNIYPVVGGIP